MTNTFSRLIVVATFLVPLSVKAICNTLLSDELPQPILEAILDHSLSDSGIYFDKEGLIVVDHENLPHRHTTIANNYNQVKKHIEKALKQNKHVLYLKGSFDLIHMGHAAMIINSLRNYMISNDLTRKDLFVVVLADHRNLVFNFKKSKWRKHGGSEDLPRPIQARHNFDHKSLSVSPRLLDLAQLPVDLVGFTPDPESALESLLKQKRFKQTLQKKLTWLNNKRGRILTDISTDLDIESLQPHLDRIIEHTIAMIEDILNNNGQQVIASFYDFDRPSVYWDLSSWQFILHLFLDIKTNQNVTTFLNTRDNDYLEQVASYVLAAQMQVATISGTDGFESTSKLIQNKGAENLLSRKIRHFHGVIKETTFLGLTTHKCVRNLTTGKIFQPLQPEHLPISFSIWDKYCTQ